MLIASALLDCLDRVFAWVLLLTLWITCWLFTLLGLLVVYIKLLVVDG